MIEFDFLIPSQNALKKVTDQRRAHNSSIASREAKYVGHSFSIDFDHFGKVNLAHYSSIL